MISSYIFCMGFPCSVYSLPASRPIVITPDNEKVYASIFYFSFESISSADDYEITFSLPEKGRLYEQLREPVMLTINQTGVDDAGILTVPVYVYRQKKFFFLNYYEGNFRISKSLLENPAYDIYIKLNTISAPQHVLLLDVKEYYKKAIQGISSLRDFPGGEVYQGNISLTCCF